MSFDPNTFMTQVTSEANDTKFILCPAGEHIGVTGEPVVKEGVSSKDGKTFIKLEVPVAISDPAVCAETGRNPTVVRYESFLDLNESGNGLDFSKGKNIGLGRIREATGNNKPGQPFTMPKLGGQMVKVMIAHQPDAKNPEVVYERIKAITAA